MFGSFAKSVFIASILAASSQAFAGWGFVSIILKEGSAISNHELQRIELSFVTQEDLETLDSIMTFLVLTYGEEGKSFSYMVDKERNLVRMYIPNAGKLGGYAIKTLSFTELRAFNSEAKSWLKDHSEDLR